MPLEFFLTSLVVILLPGTGVIYTLAVGLAQGFRSSIAAAFGCTLGIVPHITASIVGLAALLHASATAFHLVKYLGVIYLFYMAWSALQDKGVLEVPEESRASPAGRIIVRGILLNILNPKLSLFFLAFLPQFIPAGTTGPTARMLVLATVFMIMTFVVFIGYGACASAARHYVISRPLVITWLRRSFAGAFAMLGIKLALSER